MPKYAQLVMGSAGVGKSTYCRALQEHCTARGRSLRVWNLDPAAEGALGYACAADCREAVRAGEVAAELGLGPNGALLLAMEAVVDGRWLAEAIDAALDEDCLAIDLPGQIELYAHLPVLKRLAAALDRAGFRAVAVFLVDAHFVTDAAKLLAGNLAALAAMCHFELPHVNVLSKCDLVGREAVERYLQPAGAALLGELNRATSARYHGLNAALARVLDEYDMVGFIPLDVTDEDSLDYVLAQVDHAIQFGEDAEPNEPRDTDDDGGGGGRGAGGDDDDGEEDDGLRDRLAAAAFAAGGDGGDGGADFFGGGGGGRWGE